MLLELLFVFCIGTFIGSFLNVVVDRLPRNQSIVKGRSHCDFCKKTLAWYDLIPVISYVMLSGKCRYCHIKLSAYYSIFEITTGLLFAITYWLFINGNRSLWNIQMETYLWFFYYYLLVSCFIVIVFIDIKFGIIPDRIVFSLIGLSIVFLLLLSPTVLVPALITGIGSFLFFLLIFLITKGRGMGFGDVKFAFVMGLILGYPNIIVAFYIAFLTGAFVSLILIVSKKKKLKGGSIPFGPFLVLGTYCALFLGESIRNLVFTFLL